MVADFEVRGADEFLRLSKALKEAGQTETRKALHKGLRDAVNAVKPEAADALASALPSGLSGRGKAVKQAVVVKTGADPGVSVVVRFGRAGRGLGASNARQVNRSGTFRHPIYADGDKTRNEWGWVDQSTGGEGWFDKTYQNAAPQMLRALEGAMQQVIDQIVQKAR